MEEEYTYQLECPVCDSILDLVVSEVDERPCFCPMCGTETEWTVD